MLGGGFECETPANRQYKNTGDKQTALKGRVDMARMSVKKSIASYKPENVSATFTILVRRTFRLLVGCTASCLRTICQDTTVLYLFSMFSFSSSPSKSARCRHPWELCARPGIVVGRGVDRWLRLRAHQASHRAGRSFCVTSGHRSVRSLFSRL